MRQSPIIDNFLLSLGLSLSLVFPAVTLFVHNYQYFTFGPPHLAALLLTVGLCMICVLFAILTACRRTRYFQTIQLGLLTAMFLIWIQASLFATLLPSLPEGPMEMDLDSIWFGWLEAIVFVVSVCSIVFLRKFILKNFTRLLLAAVVYNFIAMVIAAREYHPPRIDSKKFRFDEYSKFTFGQQENRILIVVDCMGRKLFHDTVAKYPELDDSLIDFIRLENMRSTVPQTMGAVPAMLTGSEFPYGLDGLGTSLHEDYLLESFASPNALMNQLKAKGFRREAYPYMPGLVIVSNDYFDNVIRRLKHHDSENILWDAWCVRITPLFLQSMLNWNLNARKMFVNEFDTGKYLNDNMTFDQANSRRLNGEFTIGSIPLVFKYLHLQGAHIEIMTDEHLNLSEDTDIYRQLRGSLTIVEDLLRHLREHGLYDSATIVVTGDHSETYTSEVMTLVKRPFQSFDSIQTDSTPHVLSDVHGILLGNESRK